MTDQCKHCDLRGDLKKCKSTDCFQHENWYAVEQQKVIDDLDLSYSMSESKANNYSQLTEEARDALQTIFANNGEDPEIERICSPLIDKLA